MQEKFDTRHVVMRLNFEIFHFPTLKSFINLWIPKNLFSYLGKTENKRKGEKKEEREQEKLSQTSILFMTVKFSFFVPNLPKGKFVHLDLELELDLELDLDLELELDLKCPPKRKQSRKRLAHQKRSKSKGKFP